MAETPSTIQLKVTLAGIKPPIWRRIVISGSATLGQLHMVLQVAMGWDNYHLHCFEIGDVRYGTADDEELDIEEVDETTVTVADAFGTTRRGIYEYDFGDSWHHQLLVEKANVDVPMKGFATCLDGKRACPPEDCGGTYGYADLLEALADPDHEEHESYVEWAGEFDPEEFDPEAVNFGLDLLG